MADANLLAAVRKALNYGSYQDNALSVYVDEVVNYLIDGGVAPEVANSTASAGVIAIGVTDLQYRNGSFSNYFKERAVQLHYKEVETSE